MRVFYGLAVDDSVGQKLIREAKRYYPKVDVKKTHWTRAGNFHITIKFLGETATADIEKINQEIIENLKETKAFTLSITGVSAFPNANSQIIAALAELHSELDELYNAVDEAVAKDGIDLDTHTFRPHITLGRRDAHEHVSLTPVLIENFTIPVNELTLYQVKQSKNGSVYLPIKCFELQC